MATDTEKERDSSEMPIFGGASAPDVERRAAMVIHGHEFFLASAVAAYIIIISLYEAEHFPSLAMRQPVMCN
jgi:hypothetical protein